MANRVRQIDIARKLDISKVSVSKALRDHPDISEETRKLVKKTAEEMGYMPNLLARSLSAQRSSTLGVVVPKIAHTFFSSVIDSIQARATDEGYGIILSVSNENEALERQHIERLMAMHVDGLLVSVSEETRDTSIFERVQQMGIPLVFFDRKPDGPGFSSVTVDDWKGAYDAVEYAIREGYRRIAHIAGTNHALIGRRRREGFEAAMRDHGISVEPSWVIPGGFNEQHGYRAFKQILEQDELPEVIFTVTFPVGIGVRGAMREHAPELMDSIEIIAFGDGGLDEFYTYPHVCVRQPTGDMGVLAVEILLEQIESEDDYEPREEVLETCIVTPDTHHPALLHDG